MPIKPTTKPGPLSPPTASPPRKRLAGTGVPAAPAVGAERKASPDDLSAAPPEQLGGRIPAALHAEWNARLSSLALPRQAALAVAVREALALDDETLTARVSGELLAAKQAAARRRQ